MRHIIKLCRERTPFGNFMAWCLRWNDGKEEYTADTAAGRDAFPRWKELDFRQQNLSPALEAERQQWHAWRRRERISKPRPA